MDERRRGARGCFSFIPPPAIAQRCALPAPSEFALRHFSPSLILFLALVLATAASSAAKLHGKVVGVADGDTITVLDHLRRPHKVRLAGIDAPERGQPYGTRSKAHLASLAYNKPVVVVWHKRDRYGRLVGQMQVVAPNGCEGAGCFRLGDVGLAQIESGLAWHYRRFEAEQTAEDRDRYARAEQDARAKREGLWKDPRPIPPWEYRNGQRAGLDGRSG